MQCHLSLKTPHLSVCRLHVLLLYHIHPVNYSTNNTRRCGKISTDGCDEPRHSAFRTRRQNWFRDTRARNPSLSDLWPSPLSDYISGVGSAAREFTQRDGEHEELTSSPSAEIVSSHPR